MNTVMSRPVEELLPTRYSLLSRLQNRDDHESWKDFFDTYWRLIYSSARKADLNDAEAQDVVQETVICVAKHLDKFQRNRDLGTFKGWLRNIIRWRVADQLARRSPARDPLPHNDDSEDPDLSEIADPGAAGVEAWWEEEWRTNLFEAAVQRVKHRVKEEHFVMFDLYVIKQWPVLKVASKLNVSVGSVYVAKHRVSALIRKEIRLLEEKPF